MYAIISVVIAAQNKETGLVRSPVLNGLKSDTGRVKREGFGPWHAQDTWDEKGRSNIAITYTHLVESITEVISEIVNETKIIIDEIEHPVNFLLKSRVGTFILIGVCVAFLAVFCIAVGPIITVLTKVFSSCYRSILYVFRTSCCIYFWSLKPFRKIRNYFVEKYRLRQEMVNLRVYTHTKDEAIEFLKRTYSNVLTDEHGAYLLAHDNHRVYFNQATTTEDILKVQVLAPSKREIEGGSGKETILSNSKLYKIPKIPDFQGQFDVDGNVIGHFARIRFRDMDCLLTAYHVLDYNRTSIIRLRKGDKLVDFNSFTTEVIIASPTTHLDYVIIKVPSFVFGSLGLKIGKWTTRVMPREAVCINQLYNGQPCVSTAAIKLFTKPWHIAYSASTTVGTSGAPILDTRGVIIGVHLEHDSVSKLNVGVVPPVFRDSRKESPTNEDLMQHQRGLDWGDSDEDEGQYDDEDEDRYYYASDDEDGDRYKYALQDELEERYLNFARKGKGKNTDWQSDFADMELAALELMEEDAMEERLAGNGNIEGFAVIKLAERKRFQYNKKHGISQKESPWTCKLCGCLHYKMAHNCANCQKVFEPAKTREDIKEFAAQQVKALYDDKNALPLVVKRIIEDKLKKFTTHKEICVMVGKALEAGKINAYNMHEITEVVKNSVWLNENGVWQVVFDTKTAPDKTPVPIEKKTFQYYVQGAEKTAAQRGWRSHCNMRGVDADGNRTTDDHCTREESRDHSQDRSSSLHECEIKARPMASLKALEVYKEKNFMRVDGGQPGGPLYVKRKTDNYIPIDFKIVKPPSNHTMGPDSTRNVVESHPPIVKIPIPPLDDMSDVNLFKESKIPVKPTDDKEEMRQMITRIVQDCMSAAKGEKPQTSVGSVPISNRRARQKANKKARKAQVEAYKAQPEVAKVTKETLVAFAPVQPQDPLNSKAPAQTGASAITGPSQNLSQKSQSSSVDQSVSSTPVEKTKPVKSGKPSAKSSQSTACTNGLIDQQKQKK